MKKQRKKSPAKSKAPQNAPNPPRKKKMTRRELISYAQMGGIGAVALGGGGFFFARSVAAAACEADLTKIGKGTPAIVQICKGRPERLSKALRREN